MAQLIYSAISSLDGYVAYEAGNFALELRDARRFDGGMVHLGYRVRS
jgi:hypothetical protein